MACLMPSFSVRLHGAPKGFVVFIISINFYSYVLFHLLRHFRTKHWTQKCLKTYPRPFDSVKIKNFTLEQTMKTQRGRRDTDYSFFNLGARWGEWLKPGPGRFNPWKRSRYPLYRRLGGPQDRSGPVRQISPPTGTRSQDCPTNSESLYRLSSPGPPFIP